MKTLLFFQQQTELQPGEMQEILLWCFGLVIAFMAVKKGWGDLHGDSGMKGVLIGILLLIVAYLVGVSGV